MESSGKRFDEKEDGMYTIYLVDDERVESRRLISKPVFADFGFEVIGSTSNPREAMAEIQALNPNGVFISLKRKDYTAFNMMERLKEKGCTAEFVVVDAAYAGYEDLRRFFISDGFDHVLWPATDKDLIRVLGRLSDKLTGQSDGKPKDHVRW